MKGIDIFYGIIALSAACYVIQQSGAFTNAPNFPLKPTDMSDMWAWSDFSILSASLAVGGLIAAIITAITKYTYASAIMIVFVFSVLWKPTNQLVTAIPTVISATLPVEVQYIFQPILLLFASISIFFFFAEILSSKSVTA